MIIVPCIELITYWFILVRPATLNEPPGGFEPLLETEECSVTVTEVKYTDTGRLASLKHTLTKFLLGIKDLRYYMGSLFLVYCSEYLINQGMFEIMWYKNISWSIKVQYRVYQVVYQVGVTISRSSASFIHFHRIHVFSILQFLNLIVFSCEARYQFIPSIWITIILILYEGLLGGACYVNAFYAIYNEVPAHHREYSLGLASVSDSFGIVLAGILSTFIHNYICKFRVQ